MRSPRPGQARPGLFPARPPLIGPRGPQECERPLKGQRGAGTHQCRGGGQAGRSELQRSWEAAGAALLLGSFRLFFLPFEGECSATGARVVPEARKPRQRGRMSARTCAVYAGAVGHPLSGRLGAFQCLVRPVRPRTCPLLRCEDGRPRDSPLSALSKVGWRPCALPWGCPADSCSFSRWASVRPTGLSVRALARFCIWHLVDSSRQGFLFVCLFFFNKLCGISCAGFEGMKGNLLTAKMFNLRNIQIRNSETPASQNL